jgi:hypothetical protein
VPAYQSAVASKTSSFDLTDRSPGKRLPSRPKFHTHLLSKTTAAQSHRTQVGRDRRRTCEEDQELGVANEGRGDFRSLLVQEDGWAEGMISARHKGGRKHLDEQPRRAQHQRAVAAQLTRIDHHHCRAEEGASTASSRLLVTCCGA